MSQVTNEQLVEAIRIKTDYSFLSSALTWDMQMKGDIGGNQYILVTEVEIEGESMILDGQLWTMDKKEIN